MKIWTSLLTVLSWCQRLLAMIIILLLLAMVRNVQIGFGLPWLSNVLDWNTFSFFLLLGLLILLIWSFTGSMLALCLGNVLAGGTLWKFPGFLSWYNQVTEGSYALTFFLRVSKYLDLSQKKQIFQDSLEAFQNTLPGEQLPLFLQALNNTLVSHPPELASILSAQEVRAQAQSLCVNLKEQLFPPLLESPTGDQPSVVARLFLVLVVLTFTAWVVYQGYNYIRGSAHPDPVAGAQSLRETAQSHGDLIGVVRDINRNVAVHEQQILEVHHGQQGLHQLHMDIARILAHGERIQAGARDQLMGVQRAICAHYKLQPAPAAPAQIWSQGFSSWAPRTAGATPTAFFSGAVAPLGGKASPETLEALRQLRLFYYLGHIS